MSNLLFQPLRRSIAALTKTLDQYQKAVSSVPVDEDYLVLARTAAIKNFEVAYEVAWKTIRRWIAATQGESEVGEWSRRDLFRQAAQLGIIADPNAWFAFHAARNAGAHTYREEVAGASLLAAQTFVAAGAQLLTALEKRAYA